MLTMRSYCSLITPPLPRIFLIWGRKDRGETTENSCKNIFNCVDWDWERGHLDGGDQRSSHGKMRVSAGCSVLTWKLSSCWSFLCSWCWSLLCFWCWSLLCSWCWWYFSRDADEGYWCPEVGSRQILFCGAISSLCKEVFDSFSYRQELQFWVIQYFTATVIYFVLGWPTCSSNCQLNFCQEVDKKITHYTNATMGNEPPRRDNFSLCNRSLKKSETKTWGLETLKGFQHLWDRKNKLVCQQYVYLDMVFTLDRTDWSHRNFYKRLFISRWGTAMDFFYWIS